MLTGLAALLIPLSIWFKLVNDTVTEPYLDEVFHVRQAQHYCQNRFDIWDPKITTPPGLYLISYALSPFFACGLTALRSANIFRLSEIFALVCVSYAERRTSGEKNGWLGQHNALNIALFPPLFFFAALYYTDVLSTLSVVVFYLNFLTVHGKGASTLLEKFILTTLGLLSLMFRQTNIFWVAIFPAGIVLVDEEDKGHRVVKESMYRRAEGFGDSTLSVARTSWKMQALYDPPVRDAWVEDYIKTLISLVTCTTKTLTNPRTLTSLLGTLSPYLTLLTLFASFTLYNGSVVLGDKTNHVATLHLPQMLYIWPYFTFFSWPLIYPYLLTLPGAVFAKISAIAPLEGMLIFKRRHLVPRVWVVGVFVVLAGLVVRFNTIIHPFTLADNRHYMFYIFRLLVRPWWMRYAVIPIYISCGWACIQALGARPLFTSTNSQTDSTTSTNDPTTVQQSNHQAKPSRIPTGSNSATISSTLIWLATTTLQLITAPLVEPRYFILPWIFWRMHLPLQQYSPAPNSKTDSSSQTALWKRGDHRLWLETAWFLLINAATGYIFLHWGFEWPQEVGKVQRFMW